MSYGAGPSTELKTWAISGPPAVTTNPSQLSIKHDWASMFGDPGRPELTHPYDETKRTTWIMPEAYRGMSQFLGNTFELLALQKNSFLTSYILPIVIQEELQSDWSRWIFSPTIFDKVPERGVVRMVKSRRRQGRLSMVRYGLGAAWEHGFMNSELGRRHYAMNLKQINQAVNETLQFDAIYNILTANDRNVRYIKDNRLQVDKAADYGDVMNRELFFWGILQQQRNGWELMDTEIDQLVSMYNPNKLTTYIVPIEAGTFLSHFPVDRVNYYIKGPQAPSIVRDGVERFSVDPRGNRIYATRSFMVDEGAPINPLKDIVEIGECIIAEDRHILNNIDEYQSRCRNVVYYNQDLDTLSTMTLSQQLEHCKRFSERDGTVLGFDDPEAMRFPTTGFSEQQKRADFLHHVTQEGRLVPVTYYGQVLKEHFGADDYRDWARTAHNRLCKLTGYSRESGKLQRAFRTLRDMVQKMARVPFGDTYNEWLRVLARKNYGELVTNTGPNNPVPAGIQDWQPNAYGSLDIPVRADFADGESPMPLYWNRWALPPTHATYGGFKTIADMVQNGTWELTGFNKKLGEELAEALQVFEAMVDHLPELAPDSLMLNAAWASSFVHGATSHDKFFEEAVTLRVGARPIFLLRGGRAAAGLDQAGDTGVFSETTTALGGGVADQMLTDQIMSRLLPEYTKAQQHLMDNVIGTYRRESAPATDTIGADIGGNDVDSFALDQNAPRPKVAEQGRQNAQTTYNRVVLLALAFVPFDGASVPEQVEGQILSSAVAATLALGYVNQQDPQRTWQAYERIVGEIARRVGIPDAELAADSLNSSEYAARMTPGGISNFIDAMRSFFMKNPNLLNAGLKDAKTGRVLERNLNAYYDSLSSSIARARQEAPNLQQRFARANNQFWNVLARYTENAPNYHRAPITMLPGAMRTFATYFVNKDKVGDPDKRAVAYGMPAASTEIEGVIGLDELLDIHEKFTGERYRPEPTPSKNTRDRKLPEKIGAGIFSSSSSSSSSSSFSSSSRIGSRAASSAPARIRKVDPEELLRDYGPEFVDDHTRVGSQLNHMRIVRKSAELEDYLGHANAGAAAANQARMQRRAENDRFMSSLRGSASVAPASNGYQSGGNAGGIAGAASTIGASLGLSGFGKPDTNTHVGRVSRQRSDWGGEHSTEAPKRRRAGVPDLEASERQRSQTARGQAIFGATVPREQRPMLRPTTNRNARSTQAGSDRINAFVNQEFSPNMRDLYAEIVGTIRGLEAMLAVMWLMTPVTKRSCQACIENDCIFFMNFILARPHFRQETLQAIKIIPGSATGVTALGHVKAEAGDDAATGYHIMNVTYYSGVAIRNPDNIFVARNIMIYGYLGGLGSGFFDRENYNPAEENYGSRGDSFFVFAYPRKERIVANPVSLTGHYDWVTRDPYPQEVARVGGNSLTHSTAPWYNGYWGFQNYRFNRPMDPIMIDKYAYGERSIPNALMFQSFSKMWSPDKRDYVMVGSQTGHWKIGTVAIGAAQARIGKAAFSNNPVIGVTESTQPLVPAM